MSIDYDYLKSKLYKTASTENQDAKAKFYSDRENARKAFNDHKSSCGKCSKGGYPCSTGRPLQEAGKNNNSYEAEQRYQSELASAKADYEGHKAECTKCSPTFKCSIGDNLANRLMWSRRRTTRNGGWGY